MVAKCGVHQGASLLPVSAVTAVAAATGNDGRKEEGTDSRFQTATFYKLTSLTATYLIVPQP